MQMPKEMLAWLHGHAELRDNKYFCKSSGQAIGCAVIGRSIWVRPFQGGFGEVRPVLHVVCTACTPRTTLPSHGDPIYSDELAAADLVVPEVRIL